MSRRKPDNIRRAIPNQERSPDQHTITVITIRQGRLIQNRRQQRKARKPDRLTGALTATEQLTSEDRAKATQTEVRQATAHQAEVVLQVTVHRAEVAPVTVRRAEVAVPAIHPVRRAVVPEAPVVAAAPPAGEAVADKGLKIRNTSHKNDSLINFR